VKPNILFLLSDEHGFRYMGYMPEEEGGEVVNTPNFDILAKKGTVFTDVYCQMPLCTPSRMCMFTGREVRNCGAWKNGVYLRPEIPTLPKTLEQHGYETCFIGKYHLGGSNQFGGFKHRPYGDLTGKGGHQVEAITESREGKAGRTKNAGITEFPESLLQENIVCNETISFLREHKHKHPDKPYFLCASFSRPHFPLTAPKRHFDRYWPKKVSEPKVGATGDAYKHPMSIAMRKGFEVERINYEEMMKARAAYFACVSFLDEIIGDLIVRLEKEGLLENTIIVYTSDHGEMAGEHGVWWKHGWYEACTRVPLIISLPEQRSGKMQPERFRTPVALIDLYPTLCGLTGCEPEKELDGIDLSEGILGNKSIPGDRPVICDNLFDRWGEGTEFRMVRLGDYKCVAFRNAPPLMFDLKNDPMEQHNIVNSEDSTIVSMREKFEKYISESMDFEKAAWERTVRDGELLSENALNIDGAEKVKNAFIMPNGTVFSADDILYKPNILARDYRDVFQS